MKVVARGLLAALAIGVLCSVGAAAAAPTHWRSFRAGGISFRYPPTWFATAQPLTAVTSPQQIIAVASYRFHPDVARADGCEPKEAFDAMPPTGAFIFGWESGQVSPLPAPRPKHFELTGFGHYDCLGARPGYMLSFSQNGRAFTVEVAFGPRVSRATRTTLLRILDTFSVKRM